MIGIERFSREGDVRAWFVPAVFFICFVFPSVLCKSLSHTSQGTNHSGLVVLRVRRAVEVEKSKSDPSPPCIENFPVDFVTQDQRRKGGVFVHFLIAFYMFGALALICDEYFIPCIERITHKLQVRSDIAGATFMAAGGSAAELFICIVGVFVAKSDIGPGTVVGSAAFNLLLVIGLCSLFAGSVLRLSRGPLLRDSLCYLLSIVVLIVITFDRKVYWYESLLLVCMYLFYIVILYHSQALEGFFKNLTKIRKNISQARNDVEKNEADDEKTKLLSEKKEGGNLGQDEESLFVTEPQIQAQINQNNESPFSIPEGIFQRSLWIMKLPILCLLYVTIPDFRKDKWKNWYFVTFAVSLTWIGLFSYVLVWMVEVIGFTLGIDDVIMGLTFIAAGGSVSDGISSMIVARRGDGDMAVSNVFGSNLFDILLCLGLPWLLKTTIVDFGGYVSVEGGHVNYTLLCLLIAVTVAVLSIMFNKWCLTKFLGILFLIFFCAFLTVTIISELYLH